MSVEQFINRFGGFTESYWFYNNTIELRYDPKAHIYYRVTGDELIPQDGVTNVCHIIDKSEVLIPWACKQMAGKLLLEAPTMTLPTGDRVIRQMTYTDYEGMVLKAKSAHKDTLEDAGKVGHTAHAWIEKYINAQIAGLSFDDPLPFDERAANCCGAAVDWMTRHNVRWICTERKIYSRTYGYAGTMDGLCRLDSCDDPLCCPHAFKDRLAVADWKTSNSLHLEYLLQTSSYMYAHNEQTLFENGYAAEIATDRWVIRLGKDDGEFQTWHAEAHTFDEDFAAFTTALSLKRAVASIKARLKEREDVIRQAEKAKRQAEKEAAQAIKCSYADKYKGTRKPNCNGGKPCLACIAKYRETHPKWIPETVPPELLPESCDKMSQTVSNTP